MLLAQKLFVVDANLFVDFHLAMLIPRNVVKCICISHNTAQQERGNSINLILKIFTDPLPRSQGTCSHGGSYHMT